MSPSIRLCLLVIHVATLSTVGAQNCDYSGYTVANPLYLLEGSLAGTVILNVTSDTILHTNLSPIPPPYLEVEDATLRFKDTLDLDNNTDWCDSLFQLKIYLSCGGPTIYTVNLRVNITDDLAPEFTILSYTATVNELTAIGEVVHRISAADIEDKDCDSNLQNPVYAIENQQEAARVSPTDGNTGGAFSIVQHTGETRVNHTLDYENGDTRFLLNISISDRAYPDRKSFTTLNVTVIDLDDNDPVFDSPAYTLHVPENESPSSLWTQTVPPISVRDPDIGVVPADPLLIALYDNSAASVLEVNGTTGDVRLLKTFDREDQESVPIVLKVQQTINSWRSSTVTLTVLIDDVNDNRPAFSPHHYDVTVSEHAAVGTTVVLVSASDKDTGDNAMFNFTLLQGGGALSLTTQLGQQRYGLLSVTSSSLLDRETTPQINITIGTLEQTPADGGDCSLIQCQATVTVTLSDINDNSPVFDNDTYVAHVNNDNVTNRDVIAKVSASDKDEGENAAVTYKLQSLGFGACADVIVVTDPGTGDVRLNNTVAQSEDCSVLITACDSPSEVSQQRCTSVPMQIIFNISNYTLMLQTSVSPDVLTPEKAVIGRELSAILGVTVTVDHTYPDTSSSGSRVFISAKNASTAEMLSREQLQLLVDGKMTEITQFFERYLQTEEPGDDDDNNNDNNAGLSLIAIAFIAVSAVFLLAFIVAVVFVGRGREKTRRQERLIQRLSASNDLYHNTADGHKAENGTASLVDHIADDSRTEGLGVTNPVYVEENDDTPADSPRSDVSSDSGPDGPAWETTTRERSGGKEEGEEEESFRERTQDADSGVPSDRENGVGDSGSEASKEATPLMPRSEREGGGGGGDTTPSSPSSSYLDAVLNDKLLQAAQYDDVGDDASDMVDVTAAPASPATTTPTTSADVHAQVVAPADTADIPYQNVTGDVSANTAAAEDPHVYVNATGNRDLPPAGGVEEQEVTLAVPAYENVNLPPAHNAILPPNDTGRDLSGEPSTTNEENNNNNNDDEDDDDDDDDDVGSRSKLAQMVRPCTPPMHHKQNAEDEEWDGEGADLPDEPEPDYAKKVRFVVPTVTEAPSAAADNQGGVGGGDDNGGGDSTTANDGEQGGGGSGGGEESPAGPSPAGEPDAAGSSTGGDDRDASRATEDQEGPTGVERAASAQEEEMTAF